MYSSLGDYSYVERQSRLIHTDVGIFCSIGETVNVGMGTHTLNKLSTSSIFAEAHNSTKHQWAHVSSDNPYRREKVGNDVWIGQQAMVMGGLAIDDGAVIGASSVVTKDVPPYAIVAGVPARIIRYRFSDELIEKIEAIKWWELPESVLRENISLFQSLQCEESVVVLSKL